MTRCALRIDLSAERGAGGDPRWLLTTVARPGLLTAAGFGRPSGCGVFHVERSSAKGAGGDGREGGKEPPGLGDDGERNG